jgi:hypothetical protein
VDYKLCSGSVAGEQHIAEIFERLSCGALRTGVTLPINNHPVAGDLG